MTSLKRGLVYLVGGTIAAMYGFKAQHAAMEELNKDKERWLVEEYEKVQLEYEERLAIINNPATEVGVEKD